MVNYYEAVLADLELKRAEIDTAITAIRRLTGSFQSNGPDVAEAGNNITEKRRAPSRRKSGRVRAAANTFNGKKPCKDCGVRKPIDDFPRNHTFSDGHTNRCKECSRTVANARAAERRGGKSQSSPPPRRSTAKQSIDPHTLKVLPAPQDPAVTGEALTCPFCHSPCSTPERYRSHLKGVHGKEVAA